MSRPNLPAGTRALRAAALVHQNLAAADLLVSRALGSAAQLARADLEKLRPLMLEIRSNVRRLAREVDQQLGPDLDALADRFPELAHAARHPDLTLSPELTEAVFITGTFDTPASPDHVDG